jgi:hypothetical protein
LKYSLIVKLQNNGRVDLCRQINNAVHSYEKQKEIDVNRQKFKKSVMKKYDGVE